MVLKGLPIDGCGNKIKLYILSAILGRIPTLDEYKIAVNGIKLTSGGGNLTLATTKNY